jgi:hypothetical protein
VRKCLVSNYFSFQMNFNRDQGSSELLYLINHCEPTTANFCLSEKPFLISSRSDSKALGSPVSSHSMHSRSLGVILDPRSICDFKPWYPKKRASTSVVKLLGPDALITQVSLANHERHSSVFAIKKRVA